MSNKNSNIPMYSSIKYSNVFELASRAERIRLAEEDGLLDIPKNDLKNLDTMQASLKLKEQILGFLEDMTSGKSSSIELSAEEFRELQDWIFVDHPNRNFPEGANEKAKERIVWLRNYINADDKNDNGKRKREVMRSLYIESRPELDIRNVENLVLAGGGAKALSLAGVVKSLEKQKISDQIKRVAGTSGGAIIAMVYAAGYSSEEIKEIVNSNNFGLFSLNTRLDNGVMNQWALWMNSGVKNSKTKLHVLSDNQFAHAYNKSLMTEVPRMIMASANTEIKERLANNISKQPGSSLEEKFKSYLGAQENQDVIIRNIASRLELSEQILVAERAKKTTIEKIGYEEYFAATSLYSTPEKAIISGLRHQMGSDMILGFFKDLVLDKLKKIDVRTLSRAIHGDDFGASIHTVTKDEIRNMSFKQWQRLHELVPDKVKELHISLSIKKPKKRDRIKMHGYDAYDHQDASHENPALANMSVAEAVRVSMNLPPVFKDYKFEVDGINYIGSDGGLKSNMSLNTFDRTDEFGKGNTHKTIGVFYKTGKELESAVDVNRMLILPRSKDKITESMKLLKLKRDTIEIKQMEVNGKLQASIIKYGSESDISRVLRRHNDDLIDSMRRNDGELSAIENELNNLLGANKSRNIVYSILNKPFSDVGKIVGRYFDTKSNDDLSGSANLRRLVMINTQDIDTLHFKMSKDDKRLQMMYGEDAMDSLLSGSYCLENHFYHHQLHTLQSKFYQSTFSNDKEQIWSTILPRIANKIKGNDVDVDRKETNELRGDIKDNKGRQNKRKR